MEQFLPGTVHPLDMGPQTDRTATGHPDGFKYPGSILKPRHMSGDHGLILMDHFAVDPGFPRLIYLDPALPVQNGHHRFPLVQGLLKFLFRIRVIDDAAAHGKKIR